MVGGALPAAIIWERGAPGVELGAGSPHRFSEPLAPSLRGGGAAMAA